MAVRVVLPENYLPGYELEYYEYDEDDFETLRPKSRPIMRKIPYPEYPEVPWPDEYVRVALRNYDNVVFYVVFSVEFKNSIDLSKILRFIEFDVEEVTLRNFSELPKGYEAFMTPNVRAATFPYCDIKMNTLLNLLPDIERLSLKPNPESDWKDLFDYKYPLDSIFIVTSKVKNWKKFSEFLKRQGNSIKFHFHPFHGWISGLNDSEKEKAMEYFNVVDCRKDPQQLNANYIHWHPNYTLYCK
uniref:DUF38 domain-containing protein n=1 Tax=Panagrolaimus sp. JU765 TaxID=591449 RepID=A0AC34QT90_9BILA